MTQHQPHQDDRSPNPASTQEQAEGSRDAAQGSAQHGAGITNRPIERERREQDEVPPRGTRKDEDHA